MYDSINSRYICLLSRFGIPLRVETVRDPALSRAEVVSGETGFTIRLNLHFIRAEDYESHLSHQVRNILLPRLVLETDRLILRRFRREDAADCFAFLSDRETCLSDGGYLPFSGMDAEYVLLMEKFEQQETRYMIQRKATGQVIGTVNLMNEDSRAVEAMEIGYVIAPAHRRRGYAFEAASALIRLLQEELALDLILAGAFPENAGSIALLKKLGFRQEGILRKALWHAEQGAKDVVHFYRER